MADGVRLTPTEALILDVLAARYRLGSRLWTFTTRVQHAAQGLQGKGLIFIVHGVTERTFRAGLTEAGREFELPEDY